MLSFKRMRQQSRPIHCKHLSLIELTTARVTLRINVLSAYDAPDSSKFSTALLIYRWI